MRRRVLTAVLCVLTFLAGEAGAQTVERNLPPEPPRQAATIRYAPPDLLTSDDQTPLGADLRAILLIGARDRITKHPKATGLDVRRIDPVLAPAIQARLAPLIGRPISRKLISDVHAAITTVYRDVGRPFVSVTYPPQEITSGVIQLRVVEARLGTVTVVGASPAQEQRILDHLQLQRGELINARQLENDLDWLNRSPFYRVEAIFGPGKELAITEVTLQVTENRPFQVFGGYANAGTQLTDRDRFFTGAAFSPFLDVVAAYQATGSKDFWADRLADHRDAKYLSHAGRAVVPLGMRSSLELIADYVQTNERSYVDSHIRNRTTEFSAIYRGAASNLFSAAPGDWLGGVELKRQTRSSFVAGSEIEAVQADVFQIVAGWADRWSDAHGSNDLDVRVKVNPGSVLPHNVSADWRTFTLGRVNDLNTAQGVLAYRRVTPLFGELALVTEIQALLADKPLPDTERFILGGAQTTRGYVMEDGVFDQAFVLRDSLYFPSFSLGEVFGLRGFDDRFAPFVFADVGVGRDIFTGQNITLASVGAGLDTQIGTYAKSNLTIANALREGPHTNAGAWFLHARVLLSY